MSYLYTANIIVKRSADDEQIYKLMKGYDYRNENFLSQLVTFLQVLKIQGDTKKFYHEFYKIPKNVDPVTVVVVISISVNIYHYL